jgi:hypothetical protein
MGTPWAKRRKSQKLLGYGGQRTDRQPLGTVDKARSLFGSEVSQPVEEIFNRDVSLLDFNLRRCRCGRLINTVSIADGKARTPSATMLGCSQTCFGDALFNWPAAVRVGGGLPPPHSRPAHRP